MTIGETARHEIVLADGAEVRSVVEQVSHHPPVTAFHSEGDGWSIYGHFRPRPRLVGMHVDVDITGKRFFRVPIRTAAAADDDAYPREASSGSTATSSRRPRTSPPHETYESTFVGFEWHFMPSLYTQMSSTEPWTVHCAETVGSAPGAQLGASGGSSSFDG